MKNLSANRSKREMSWLFNSAKEAFVMAVLMLTFCIIPVLCIFLNADKLGSWWLVVFFAYCAVLTAMIYCVYRYRELIEVRGYFTEEEFRRKYPKDLELLKFVEKFTKYFVN